MTVHRLSTIQQVDAIFVLEHGKVIERGSDETLMERKGLYHQMHRMQQGQRHQAV